MRKVEVMIRKKVADKWIDEKAQGLFHQWGTECEEFEHGAVQVSMGIVELNDGTIETIHPLRIKFIPDYFV